MVMKYSVKANCRKVYVGKSSPVTHIPIAEHLREAYPAAEV